VHAALQPTCFDHWNGVFWSDIWYYTHRTVRSLMAKERLNVRYDQNFRLIKDIKLVEQWRERDLYQLQESVSGKETLKMSTNAR